MPNYGIARPMHVDGPIGRGFAKSKTVDSIMDEIKNDPAIRAALQDAIDNPPPAPKPGVMGGETHEAHIRKAMIAAMEA
jgi:hypothetical protein